MISLCDIHVCNPFIIHHMQSRSQITTTVHHDNTAVVVAPPYIGLFAFARSLSQPLQTSFHTPLTFRLDPCRSQMSARAPFIVRRGVVYVRAVRLVVGGRADDVPRTVLLEAIRLASAIVAGGSGLTWLGFRHDMQVRKYSIDRERMPNTLLVCVCVCVCVYVCVRLSLSVCVCVCVCVCVRTVG